MDERLRRGLAQVLADVEIGIDQAQEKEAQGFVILVVDLESEEPVSIYGTWDASLDALAQATRWDNDRRAGVVAEGEKGWQHIVLPFFDKDDLRPRKPIELPDFPANDGFDDDPEEQQP